MEIHSINPTPEDKILQVAGLTGSGSYMNDSLDGGCRTIALLLSFLLNNNCLK